MSIDPSHLTALIADRPLASPNTSWTTKRRRCVVQIKVTDCRPGPRSDAHCRVKVNTSTSTGREGQDRWTRCLDCADCATKGSAPMHC